MEQTKPSAGGTELGRHAADRKQGTVKDMDIRVSRYTWISLAVVLAICTIGLGIYLWPKGAPTDNGAQTQVTEKNDLDRKQIIDTYNKGDYKAVIPSLESFLAANKNDAQMREMLASSYLLSGDNKRASDEYQLLLKTKPNDAELLYKTGILLERMGRQNEAITYLNRAAQTAPNVILFHSEVARADTRAKYYDNAIDEWKKVLGLLPPADKLRSSVLAELANIYILQNDFVQAKGIIATGLSIDPNNETLKALESRTGGQIQGLSPSSSSSSTNTGAGLGGN
ncbi:tetratricopeptide repeat protein [Candidatus Aquicultor sp.]